MKDHLVIQPTPEQRSLWFAEAIFELSDSAPLIEIAARVADKAYKAGAARELGACLTWIQDNVPRLPDGTWAEQRLREFRRPRKTLEDLAAVEIDRALETLNAAGLHGDFGNVRMLIAQVKAQAQARTPSNIESTS